MWGKRLDGAWPLLALGLSVLGGCIALCRAQLGLTISRSDEKRIAFGDNRSHINVLEAPSSFRRFYTSIELRKLTSFADLHCNGLPMSITGAFAKLDHMSR